MLFFRRKKIVQKKSLLRFKIYKDEKGTIGVFRDYSYVDEVIKAFEVYRKDFDTKNSQTSRSKQTFIVSIGGSDREFIVKGKNTNFLLNDVSYPHSVIDLKERDIFCFQVSNFSALHELLSNREASRRYKNKYNRDLPIEKPVGFYISSSSGQRGARWVIFEYIPNILSVTSETINFEHSLYNDRIRDELNMIGVYNRALFKRNFDLVPVRDEGDINFVIVDSEDWYIKRI